MKIAFFNCINDLVLNKNDELKYLILYFEEKHKKNLLGKYFNNWKNSILGAMNMNNIKKYKIQNNNINIIYRNKESNNKLNYKEKKHFSTEENINQKKFSKEKELIEMEKYIIDYDEDLINKNKIKENNNINENKINIRAKTDDENEKMEKYRKKFKELEEEYRIKYLLSSKNDINDNEAENIINIKNSINKAINFLYNQNYLNNFFILI